MTVLAACDSDELERLVGNFADEHADDPTLRSPIRDIKYALEDEENTDWATIYDRLELLTFATDGTTYDKALALMKHIVDHGLVEDPYA